ncbi:MAG TPA: MBL fold metallo-hydrolase [Phycisphaerae bacterium]|nr:MBL fold metallo-hydrolase [Phycisphaerae bacterium]
MNRIQLGAFSGLLVVGVLVGGVQGQTRPAIEVRTIPVRENVYMLAGAGGNLGVCVGEDGVLLIDSEYAELNEKVVGAVKAISDRPIRFVINTHWHFDHVGGNELLAAGGAVVVAHENVRKRMSSGQYLLGIDRQVPASPAAALPTVTFGDRLTFHWNGDEVAVVHVETAHTDGDSIVFFRKANVIHLGDVCFAGMYPFIDVNAGGSIDGMVAAVDAALALSNDETKFIPGHGPLSDVAGLRSYRQMLATVRDRVRALVDQGKTREEVVAAKPTADLDAAWARAFQPDTWVGLIYDGMTREQGGRGKARSSGPDRGP